MLKAHYIIPAEDFDAQQQQQSQKEQELVAEVERLKKIEAAYNNLSEPINAHTRATNLNTVENEINEVIPLVKEPTHIKDGIQYAKIGDSAIHMKGVLDKFINHPKIGPAIKSVLSKEDFEKLGAVWLPVVIYKELNGVTPSVVMAEEFTSNFQPITK